MLLVATLVALLLSASQQQQVADAWWFGSSATADSTMAPTAAQAKPAAGQIKAVAKFDMDGARGVVKFTQRSPKEPTLVEYDLSGLKGNNKLYHVHVRPVPKFDADKARNNATMIAQLCGDQNTGGHLNPHHITEKLPPKSAPLDKYELGDLSGKHGPFAEVQNQPDHYKGSFMDDKLPMSGEHSIIGRSVVIHKNAGPRWICASIHQAS